MDHQDNLFKEFNSVSAEAWLTKIKADLKGKELASLHHQVGADIELSPFHHADTRSGKVGPIARSAPGNQWQIGESFQLGNDLKLTNKNMLHALENGVEAVHLTIDRNLSEADLMTLFRAIEPAYIFTQFSFTENVEAIAFLNAFAHILSEKKGERNRFYGSVDLAGTSFDQVRKWTRKNLPGFSVWTISAPFGDPVDQLTKLIESGIAGFDHSEDATIAEEVLFKVATGTDYFVEIAKLRALRIVWANVLKAYQISSDEFPKIMVVFAAESQSSDPNQNMIRATTMAMAAAIGGADLLIVSPAGKEEKKTTGFYRRIARNVQHILKMESFLDRVKDVAAGSYYVETLTTKIGEAVWKNLKA